jgi:sulfur-carrier protein
MARVLYFAWLREAVGLDGEDVDLLLDETAAELAARLAARGGGYAAALGDQSRIRCALDQEMASLDVRLRDVKEIAFFPPVTGG